MQEVHGNEPDKLRKTCYTSVREELEDIDFETLDEFMNDLNA
jgi:hypothetical protein